METPEPEAKTFQVSSLKFLFTPHNMVVSIVGGKEKTLLPGERYLELNASPSKDASFSSKDSNMMKNFIKWSCVPPVNHEGSNALIWRVRIYFYQPTINSTAITFRLISIVHFCHLSKTNSHFFG